MKLHSINDEQQLYVMHEGSGYTCYGFAVLERKARAVARWTGKPPPTFVPGTREHFCDCNRIMEYGRQFASATKQRCDADLTPQLIGLEGKRVEVTYPDGEKKRFTVGKSMGWMPCHLEIERGEDGGAAVYLPAGSTVRVL